MRFAHLSDMHLGFQRSEALQKIEQEIFEKALDVCITRKVDFILIAGDMFHVNIPEMRVQRYAFAKFREVHEAGIPVYVVYGSHDFSPVSSSVIDLLADTGYITKVTSPAEGDSGRIALDFVQDEKTGVKIAGFPGLKAGKDSAYYERLDRRSLESESGFKIFMFHGGLAEMKSGDGPEGQYMPLSMLPRNLKYYAGGHLHKFVEQTFNGYARVVYPGTIFAGYHSDLEDNARGQKRGLVIVEFEDDVQSVELVEIEGAQYEFIRIDAKNKTSGSVREKMIELVSTAEPAQKIVIIKVTGQLTSGKTTDIDFAGARQTLMERGALEVNISRSGLSSMEYNITQAAGQNKDEIEFNVFTENIGGVKSSRPDMKGTDGVETAKKLLHGLAQPPLENEHNAAYKARITGGALGILGLGVDDP